jgi:hypothetical protein
VRRCQNVSLADQNAPAREVAFAIVCKLDLLLVRRLASLTSFVFHEGKPRIVWPVRFVQAALGGVFRVRDRTGLLKQLDGLHRTAHFGEEERLEAAVGAPHVTVGLVLQDLAEEMRAVADEDAFSRLASGRFAVLV